jgi:ankyrin repeat protein
MKLNINYLKRISACYKAIAYYENKYGKKKIDVMTGFNEACAEWRVWFLSHADANVVEYLINHGADVNIRDNHGYTALIWASRFGHIDIVRQLLDAGADVNASDDEGETALAWAKWNNNTAIIELLKSKGAKK